MSRPTAWGHRLGTAAFAVLTALLVRGSCEAEPVEPPEPPAVEWGHCRRVVAGESGLVCSYDPDVPVRLWIDHPRAAEARLWIDGVEVAAERYWLAEEPEGEGRRVTIPTGALLLALEVPDEGGARRFELALRQHDPEATHGAEAEVVEWQGLLSSGDPAAIEQAGLRTADRLWGVGQVGNAVIILCGTSFALREARAFDAAERMLARAETLGGALGIHRSTIASYRGQLAWSRGSLRDAAMRLREGARLSLRLEDAVGLGEALPIYAEALARLGYYDEARHWVHASTQHLPDHECNRARVLRTLGWIDLVLRARGQPHDDPRRRLEQAIEIYRSNEACAHEQDGARLSLALLAFGDGDSATAARELEAIDVATLSAEDRVRAADLRVRLRLRTDADSAAARRAWEELDAAARVVDDDDARWRVEVRRGELLKRDGEAPAALEALARAEQHLDRLMRAQAVLGVGLTATAERYLEGTTALISLLVEQGQHERALCVMREARARRRSAAAGADALPAAQREEVEAKIRRYHEQKRLAEDTEAQVLERPREQEPSLRHEAERAARAASELADEIVETLMLASASPRCEQLVRPAAGELLVGIYPRESDWLLLTQDAGGTSTQTIPAPSEADRLGDPRALGEQILDPIDAALTSASRVRVLADREAQAIDVHALPWRGEPLLVHMPVAYGVELPARAVPATEGAPRALVLADPTGTLASALAEVEVVEERLEQAGWQVDAPATNDPRAPFEPSFAGYSLLHYAAHTATRQGAALVWAPYPAGEAGGLPHLQIGRNSRLEVHDILALRPVPPVAFLAGCKTGLVELDAGSTSAALAFLLADGQQVVASRENVDDAEGLAIARRFYAFFGRRAGLDAAVAMHLAQAELLRAGHGVVPYRVWVR